MSREVSLSLYVYKESNITDMANDGTQNIYNTTSETNVGCYYITGTRKRSAKIYMEFF